jgi:hypothetical protein
MARGGGDAAATAAAERGRLSAGEARVPRASKEWRIGNHVAS